jgi:hypothetical protein
MDRLDLKAWSKTARGKGSLDAVDTDYMKHDIRSLAERRE